MPKLTPQEQEAQREAHAREATRLERGKKLGKLAQYTVGQLQAQRQQLEQTGQPNTVGHPDAERKSLLEEAIRTELARIERARKISELSAQDINKLNRDIRETEQKLRTADGSEAEQLKIKLSLQKEARYKKAMAFCSPNLFPEHTQRIADAKKAFVEARDAAVVRLTALAQRVEEEAQRQVQAAARPSDDPLVDNGGMSPREADDAQTPQAAVAKITDRFTAEREAKRAKAQRFAAEACKDDYVASKPGLKSVIEHAAEHGSYEPAKMIDIWIANATFQAMPLNVAEVMPSAQVVRKLKESVLQDRNNNLEEFLKNTTPHIISSAMLQAALTVPAATSNDKSTVLPYSTESEINKNIHRLQTSKWGKMLLEGRVVNTPAFIAACTGLSAEQVEAEQATERAEAEKARIGGDRAGQTVNMQRIAEVSQHCKKLSDISKRIPSSLLPVLFNWNHILIKIQHAQFTPEKVLETAGQFAAQYLEEHGISLAAPNPQRQESAAKAAQTAEDESTYCSCPGFGWARKLFDAQASTSRRQQTANAQAVAAGMEQEMGPTEVTRRAPYSPHTI